MSTFYHNFKTNRPFWTFYSFFERLLSKLSNKVYNVQNGRCLIFFFNVKKKFDRVLLDPVILIFFALLHPPEGNLKSMVVSHHHPTFLHLPKVAERWQDEKLGPPSLEVSEEDGQLV